MGAFISSKRVMTGPVLPLGTAHTGLSGKVWKRFLRACWVVSSQAPWLQLYRMTTPPCSRLWIQPWGTVASSGV